MVTGADGQAVGPPVGEGEGVEGAVPVVPDGTPPVGTLVGTLDGSVVGTLVGSPVSGIGYGGAVD